MIMSNAMTGGRLVMKKGRLVLYIHHMIEMVEVIMVWSILLIAA